MKIIWLKRFLIFHLFLVFIGGGLFSIPNKVLNEFTVRYSFWTGGGFPYGFFSPNIGYQTVVKTYTLVNNKILKKDAFGTGENMFDSRLSTVMHTFRNYKAYELMSRVIAAYVFVKYPDSNITFVSIGEYQSPSMEEYRLFSKKAHFQEVYYGTYQSK